MSNPTQLLPGTSIAATSWIKDGTLQLRVFTQDVEGGIRESRWNKGWSGGTSKDVIVKAKPNSPIAVFNYNTGGSIRVYYLSVDNVVSEIAQDNNGSWFAGALNKANIKAHPVSRLAVIGHTWNDNHISVYYQQPDERLGEIKQDNNGWNRGGVIGDKPFVGTGLAAFTYTLNGEPSIRVYYQLADRTLAEAGIDKGGLWFPIGGFKSANGAPTTELAALSNGNNENTHFQVYFLNRQNLLTLKKHDNGNWGNEEHPLDTTTSPSSGVAIITAHNENSLRVYIQNELNQIQELVREGTGNWTKGAIIPTGPSQ